MRKAKRKSKPSNVAVAKPVVEDIKPPYIKFTVKEIGNLPNPVIGQTNYTLKLSSTVEGCTILAVESKLLYPCLEKVTHKTDWEWHLKLPPFKQLDDFFNISSHFIVVQLFEEITVSENPPAEPSDNILPRVTELGSMVINLEDILLNPNGITKTQVFYGEEVIPLKLTWTNSPFIKFNLLLEDIAVPERFSDVTVLEITFDSIVNLPKDVNEYTFLLEVSFPYSNEVNLPFKLQFETAAEKFIYQSYSKLSRYGENIKYSKMMINPKKSLDDFHASSEILIRENIDENSWIPQSTCQRFVLPTPILKAICEQEELTLQLHLLPIVITKSSKKHILSGSFNLNAFLEQEITTRRIIVPLLNKEPLLDKDGYNSCVLLEFKISSHIANEPYIDPQIEIDAAKLALEKAHCEQNISKYLKIKILEFIQNYQKNFKTKYLKQSESLTNLNMFDSFYLYNEKHFLTAAVNYLSVNRGKYGNFRDPEVRKKCYIDLCDFTTETMYKLDDRSPLPEPCPKELFELGYREEAHQIHIMVSPIFFTMVLEI